MFQIAETWSPEFLLRHCSGFRLFSQLSPSCIWGLNMKPFNPNDFYPIWSSQFYSPFDKYCNFLPWTQSTAWSQLGEGWVRFCGPGERFLVYRFSTQLGMRVFWGEERLNSLRSLNFRANIYFEYNRNPWQYCPPCEVYLNFQHESSTSHLS